MDKFGIFKLLNSFYDFYNKNKDRFTKDNSTSTHSTEKNKPPEKMENLHTYLPLQTPMIKTMTSHDELIKRVMQNAKKQHPQK